MCSSTEAWEADGNSKVWLEFDLSLWEDEMKGMTRMRNSKSRSVALLATAAGAVAVGAFAIGALAIGRLVIRRMAIESAKIKSLEIEDLTVKRLHAAEAIVSQSLKLPENDTMTTR